MSNEQIAPSGGDMEREYKPMIYPSEVTKLVRYLLWAANNKVSREILADRLQDIGREISINGSEELKQAIKI
jgi:hypothetical protein